ncbi:hypothetical protein UlMin_024499 [Ulmus minor]
MITFKGFLQIFSFWESSNNSTLSSFLMKNRAAAPHAYRENIVLGTTNCSIFKVYQILRELSREWPGSSYDLLSKNCNHLSDEFCDRLAVPKLPVGHAGDAAVEVAGTTALKLRQAKTQIVSARKVAYRFLVGVTNNVANSTESSGNSDRVSPRFQTGWLNNLITTGAKPSDCSKIENQEKASIRQHQQSSSEAPMRSNSQSRHDT